MRKIIAIVCSCFTANVWAINYDKKNHIDVGINAFYRDYSEDLVRPLKSDESGMLYGVVLGYEHKAPHCFMFDINVGLAAGETDYDGALQNQFGEYVEAYESTTANGFFNIDTTIGYTFVKNGKHLITPFVGTGIASWIRALDDMGEVYTWGYFSYGLQYDYNANRQWQYGLHIKVMPMFEGDMEAPDTSNNIMTLGNKTHFQVSAPILYQHPDSKNYWRWTPYYQYQAFGKSDIVSTYSRNIYIHEPASRTHIVGIKAEYAFGF